MKNILEKKKTSIESEGLVDSIHAKDSARLQDIRQRREALWKKDEKLRAEEMALFRVVMAEELVLKERFGKEPKQ